jgi:molybdopterin/thiamine biosynthesis adenylyltransferase
MPVFDYSEAFSRNRGILHDGDIARLRSARVSIAGVGGAGSNYLLALTRLGVEKFTIADHDIFELTNINRQAGATMPNLGRNKAEVLAEMAAEINPDIDVRVLSNGLDRETGADFFADTTVVMDTLDLLVMNVRDVMHEEAQRRGCYVVTGAVPIGYGVATTTFGPGSMSYWDSFGIDKSDSNMVKMNKMIAGLTSAGFPQANLPPKFLDFGPSEEDVVFSSLASTHYLGTGVAVTEVLCLLLGKRQPTLAPNILQIDMLSRGMAVSRLRTARGDESLMI